MELITGFILSIVAGLLTEWILKYLGKPTITSRFSKIILKIKIFSPKTLSNAIKKGRSETIQYFVKWLEADQDTSGLHSGQFGRISNLAEEKGHQQTAVEIISNKPRMYLTRWPCYVLNRYGLSPKALSLATEGITKLLSEGNGVIRIAQSASPDMQPYSTPTLISFRHTLRAIQILLELKKWDLIPLQTIGDILDLNCYWQNTDGGWAQCDQVFTMSDLLASTYAAGLLFALWKSDIDVAVNNRYIVEKKLEKTISYLRICWEETKWVYGSASIEQFIPLILNEIAPILTEITPDLLQESSSWLKKRLTPSGFLKREYLKNWKNVSETSANIRVAHALYQIGGKQNSWFSLYNLAINSFDNSSGVNCTDVAFLLNLSFNINESGTIWEKFKFNS